MTAEKLIAILNVVALVTMMLSMGLQVTLHSALSAARPASLVAKTVIANFVLVPGVALALLYFFQAKSLVSIGFLILAVCPGAPVSPPMATIAKGNLALAVGMMIILAGFSAILAPALLGLLLKVAASQNDVQIDFVAIVRSLLIAQIAPLAIGFLIHHVAPQLSATLNRPLDLVAKVLMLALISAILITQHEMLADIRLRGWCGMGLLLAASLAIGWIVAGPVPANRRAIAVTTGPRNVAVGLVIAAGNFAGTPAITAVVAYGLVSMIGTLILSLWWSRSPCTG